MKYPLLAFMKVCQRREDAAQTALLRAKQATETARLALEAAKQAHQQCVEERPGRERELFASIKGQVLTQGELDDFHIAVRALLEEELRLARAVEERSTEWTNAQTAEAQSHEQWQAAMRETAKIAEHRARWDKERRLAAEKAEEAEMERA